jgi:hypothetical protein
MPQLSDDVIAEYDVDTTIGILCVPNHRDEPERQHDFWQFQEGFATGCQNGLTCPEQLSKMPSLKRPVSAYVYGFRQGRRYIKRAQTTTVPMQYDRSVWNGFRRWERNYKEG